MSCFQLREKTEYSGSGKKEREREEGGREERREEGKGNEKADAQLGIPRKRAGCNRGRHPENLLLSSSLTLPESPFEPELLVSKYQQLTSTNKMWLTHRKCSIIISIFKSRQISLRNNELNQGVYQAFTCKCEIN